MQLSGKYSRKLTGKLDGYIAAGWFRNTKAPVGRDDSVGTDVMLIGTYHLNDVLAVDFGAAFASLDDSLSGYSKGAAGAYNQAAGVSRDKHVLFSRIQAEF